MKKLSTLTLIFVFTIFYTTAGVWNAASTANPEPAEITLLSTDKQSSRIHFTVPGFDLTEVKTEQGTAYLISLDEATPMLEATAPDLLKLTASVMIPDMAGMDVRVIKSDYTDYNDILIAPSKGNLTRDINPEDVPFVFGDTYSENEFFPGTLAGLREPYIIRDYRGQTVVIYPFQYNPVTRVLRVYHSMEVEVYQVNEQGSNPLLREKTPEKIAVEYAMIYERHFLNPPSMNMDYTPVSEHGNMLIISYGAFMPAMQPFIDWRIQTGTPVEMVDVATIGGSAQIKSYIANYYNSNGLTFVLLVGDAAQVPSSYSNGDSDNNYSYIVGSDHYPDLFIGRFSAETIEHVEIQVERTLTYEQNPDMEFDWFTRGIGISSNQGPGDDGEYDYEHIRNIHTDLLDFTYTFCAELFDGSQGGNDAPGNPTPAMVAAEVNTGATIINYTGHGSTNSWGSSGFSSGDVGNLTNVGMWPFIWSVACVNGNFVGGSCFAEAWLRAEDNGQPTGAVATMMSTINQSWNPPMCGQDEMVDVLVETYPSNINRTFGATSMHGCMKMNDEYGAQGDDMTDTWVCFGDPSLHVRTAFPQTMTASYMGILFIGMDELTITADAEGGTACLTKNGEILATGFINGGSVSLSFPELTEPCTLTLTITGFNFLPYIDQIEVVPGNTPFLTFDDDHVIDPNGNNNGALDFGESVTYTIDILNLGGVDATDVEVSLSTQDPYITLTDDFEMYDLIPAGQVVGVSEGFAMTVAENVPDQHIIDFTLTASNADTTWIIEYQASAFAPILGIAEMIVDDATSGNGNGRLDPGETATLKVKNFNEGHCPAENSEATLTSDCQYLTFSNNVYPVGTLGLLGFKWSEFEVVVDGDAPDGAAIAEFDYTLTSGGFIETKSFSKKIGLIHEDWETGDFTKFEWETGGDVPFQVSNIYPFEGIFSAKSGAVDDNQMSELEIDVEVMIADSLTFVYKVSSQTNKDKLKFYINNTLMDEWSGMASLWNRVAYPVSTGNHTFKWVYEKDASGMVGYDCAWIDFITFPPLMTLTCYAGPDAQNCQGESFQCQGEATDWVSVEWTSEGDGTFDDATSLQPIYTPGSGDITNGNVMLSLTATNIDNEVVDDEMTLLLIDTPEQPAMPDGPTYVNLNNVTSSTYTVESLQYASNYEWAVAPVEAGDITGMGTTAEVNWNSSFLGTALISVQAANMCGESIFSDALEVTVDNVVKIAEQEDKTRLYVYPNPGNGTFKIATTRSIAKAHICIHNILGEQVINMQKNIGGDEVISIDLGTAPDGIYILSITTEKERYTRKLIVQ